MSVHLCDRCGDITLSGEGCTCTTPYSLREIRRRHQAAIASARGTAQGLSSPGDERAAPRRTAAAAFSGQHAHARVPDPDSITD